MSQPSSFSSVAVCSQSRPTLCGHMDRSLPGSFVHGIFQARILQWVTMSYSKVSSQPRDQSCVSCVSCIGRQILYHVSSEKPTGIIIPLSVSVEGHNETTPVMCHEIPKRVLLAPSVLSLLRVAVTPAAISPKLTMGNTGVGGVIPRDAQPLEQGGQPRNVHCTRSGAVFWVLWKEVPLKSTRDVSSLRLGEGSWMCECEKNVGHRPQQMRGGRSSDTCAVAAALETPRSSGPWVPAVSDLSARTASLLPSSVQHSGQYSRGRGFSIAGSFQSCQEGVKCTFPGLTSEVLIQLACGEARESVFVFPLFFFILYLFQFIEI